MKTVTIAAIAAAAMSLSGCGMLPGWQAYMGEQRGKAELARAEQNRRIRVLEAQTKLDSAKLTALAEIEKAKGDAEANRIMVNSLGGHEGYLRWKYIEMLEENKTATTIYIPTEAGLPVLEAGYRK